jgi:hypothetical protein
MTAKMLRIFAVQGKFIVFLSPLDLFYGIAQTAVTKSALKPGMCAAYKNAKK